MTEVEREEAEKRDVKAMTLCLLEGHMTPGAIENLRVKWSDTLNAILKNIAAGYIAEEVSQKQAAIVASLAPEIKTVLKEIQAGPPQGPAQ